MLPILLTTMIALMFSVPAEAATPRLSMPLAQDAVRRSVPGGTVHDCGRRSQTAIRCLVDFLWSTPFTGADGEPLEAEVTDAVWVRRKGNLISVRSYFFAEYRMRVR